MTVIVDERGIGGEKVYAGCASGEQSDALQALKDAGFTPEGTANYGLAFICRIDGEPTVAEQDCDSTPPADAYWSYWRGKPGGQWSYSAYGATSPKTRSPVNSVEGWAFGEGSSPRVEPLDGGGPDPYEASFEPRSLAFEAGQVGSPSAALTAKLTNHDTRSFQLGAIEVAGPQAGDFTVAGQDCSGHTLAGGESCQLSVSFDPAAAGGREGLLVVAIEGSSQKLELPLAGAGISPSTPPASPPPTGGSSSGSQGTLGFGAAEPPAVRSLQLDGDGVGDGLVGVSWQPAAAGPGVSSWTIAARVLGSSGGYTSRVSGAGAVTSALVQLSPGFVYQLEITLTGPLGGSTTAGIGRVVVPHDARWSGLLYRGHWRRRTEAGAWMKTVTRGHAGEEVSAQLPAGHPLFMLRGGPGARSSKCSPARIANCSRSPRSQPAPAAKLPRARGRSPARSPFECFTVRSIWMAWRSNAERRGRARWRELGLALGVALAASAGMCATAAAGPPPGPRLDAMVRYLQLQQGRDGGFPPSPGGIEASDFTAWAALALAAAGINPQEQSAPEGQSAFAYLLAHAGSLSSTTDFERELLVVEAAGTDPHDFAGRDLVSAILGRQITEGREAGAFEHEAADPGPRVNNTVFAILALSPIHEEAVTRAVALARDWLVRVQNGGEPQQGGGSWPSVSPDTVTGEPEHNVEMTGAAIQALAAAGEGASATQARALGFLRQAEEPDGGFPEKPGEAEANVASTAWAVQGIWAAGENPETWQREGNQPLGYMESMQVEDGSLRYDAGSYENPIWITSYAGLAFAGAYFPLAPVALAQHTAAPATGETSSSSQTPTPAAVEAGHGGVAGQQVRGGVIVGGGGDGAAAFSRPEPQSKGQTPGGVRQLTNGRAGADRDSAPSKRPPAAGTQTVKGVLLSFRSPQPGAPGLHSAAAGGSSSPWLAIAIALAAAGLALLGARLERRRPRVAL